MTDVNSNDPVLFEELFRRYYTLLTAKAFELCSNWQMAEDAVQEFFADTWTKKNWHTIANFAAYAVKGVQYKTITLLRKLSRQSQIESSPTSFEISNTWQDTEQMEDKLQRELKLIDALNGLPPQQKEAFLQAHYHNRSYAEIAGEMRISVNTVKTHLRLAMNRLREILTIFFMFFIIF